jgi:hypothetical protein
MKFCSLNKVKASNYFFILVLTYFLSIIVLSKKIVKKASQSSSMSKDPFSALGIPDLNPKELLKEIDNKKEEKKPYTQLKTIEDLPKFLSESNLSEEEGIKILTKFLIQVI